MKFDPTLLELILAAVGVAICLGLLHHGYTTGWW
jgi:hypothetical protein